MRLTAPDGYQAERSYSMGSAWMEGSPVELTIQRIEDGEVSSYLTEGVSPGAAIYVTHWVWESSPNTTLTTFAVPEPTAFVLLIIGAAPTLRRRRVYYFRSCGNVL